ncbi:MAG: helix-turn-helix domain-containing protein [Myroides sp.]|nr:helix-turn-helix domain-containing protein [Myroides sp.]
MNDSIDYTEIQNKKITLLKEYIAKAKREDNREELLQGYRNIMLNLPKEEAVVYSDSLLQLAFNSKKDIEIATAYQSIATLYYTFKDYKSSLEASLLAEEYVLKTDNTYNLYKIRNSIARVKYFIGDTKEALKIFIQAEEYYANQNGINNQLGQLNSIIAISKCFIELNDWDNTHRYNQKGLTLSTLIDNTEERAYWENYFLLLEGIYYFHQNDFITAQKMLNQSLNMFIQEQDEINRHIIYLYLGKICWEQKQHDKAIEYFKKVSNLFIQKKQTNNTLREAFTLLIEYYKEEKNLEQQLVYTNQLIDVDRLLNSQYKVLENKIRSEHDSRKILETKKQLEEQIKQQETKSKVLTIASISLIILTLGYFVWNKKKTKKTLHAQSDITIPRVKEDEELENEFVINEEIALEEDTISVDDLNINENIIAEILQKLEQFENDKLYLKQNITLKVLAEEWDTNTSYLSKIINTYKKNNFKQYLNDLRIDYAVEKLKESNNLRSYKTDALAEYFGFNNVRSFTDAFHIRKGIKLSSYIKEFSQND